jgi:hypothetical protein
VSLADDLEKLRAARANGYRLVRLADREVQYKSDGELAAAIADLERRIAKSENRNVSVVRVTTSKGFTR